MENPLDVTPIPYVKPKELSEFSTEELHISKHNRVRWIESCQREIERYKDDIQAIQQELDSRHA